MKKLILYILLLSSVFTYAQKIGYVDTQHILKQMPQYQQSEERLNAEVKKWQSEIVSQQSKLEKLRNEYENEKVLLTDNQRKTKLSVIDSTEKNLNEYIDKKFGTKGESTTLRYNLIKPLQDQIWNTINSIASKDRYSFIFDKSSDLIMVFTDSKYDVTDKVIKQLGGVSTETDKDTRTSGSTKATTSKKTSQAKEIETKKETSKPKSGYGSKYVPKKKQTKSTEVEAKEEDVKEETIEDNNAKVEVSETKKTTEKKPKSGYGTKYVPKKKQAKSAEVKTEEVSEIKTSEKEEIKTTEKAKATTTDKKPKSGYGSKYVPKKKQESQQK